MEEALAALQKERSKLQGQLELIDATISMLGGKSSGKGRRGKRGKMSAAHKAKLAAAQKKRWAKVRATKKPRKSKFKNKLLQTPAKAE